MNRIKTVAIGALLISTSVGLQWMYWKPSPSPRADEVVRLSIPPDALDIGTVWENQKFVWIVPLENQEAELVEVEAFGRNCNCLSVEPSSFVLQPGERRDLRLEIDLTSQVKSTGEVEVRLSPRLKLNPGTELAKRRPPEWTVKGQVRRALSLEREIYLGRHSEFSQPLSVRTVPVEVLAPLESLSVSCTSPHFSATVELPPDGQRHTVLRLTPTETLSEGKFQGLVELKGLRKGGKPLPARKLRFSGRIVADVEAVPPVVQVGGRRLGETFEEVVILRSMTGRMVTAARAEAKGEGLSVEAIEDGKRFRIRQKVTAQGAQTNEVNFATKSGGHSVTIRVPVSYTGIENP